MPKDKTNAQAPMGPIGHMLMAKVREWEGKANRLAAMDEERAAEVLRAAATELQEIAES